MPGIFWAGMRSKSSAYDRARGDRQWQQMRRRWTNSNILRFSILEKEGFIMTSMVNEQYIVDEKGKPTAVILPIEDYKKILSLLEEVENRRENKILSQSAEFKKLVKRGLEDIKTGRIKPWKEVWDDL
jgi:PHD/YefM family antitoxin component YafN of YafNO toxin-antitoxin module